MFRFDVRYDWQRVFKALSVAVLDGVIFETTGEACRRLSEQAACEVTLVPIQRGWQSVLIAPGHLLEDDRLVGHLFDVAEENRPDY